MEPFLAGLFVFGMRLTDMSLDTLRLLFVMRGRKFLAGAIGATQAAVFILAVSAVLSGPLNVFTVTGYALGFGAGVILGMYVEERLAIGYAMLRVYSSSSGHAIAEALRAAGHAVTEIQAHGREGQMIVANCVISRRNIQAVHALIDSIDASAFVTIDQAQSLQRGYFRH